MRDAKAIAEHVRLIRTNNAKRDQDYMKVVAIRKGDYETVAPGLFNTKDFDKPLVANLIDTTARDIAEVMAPLPSFNCNAGSASSDAERKRQDIRGAVANSYVQYSRLQDQSYEGADRYGSFGFMAYIVEPNFTEQMPCIRIGSVPTAHYTKDYRGRTKSYFEVCKANVCQLIADFPDAEDALKARFGRYPDPTLSTDVVRYYDDDQTSLISLDPCLMLVHAPNRVKRCPVRIVERPHITGEGGVRGQFDDVIWVQVARALVAMYTLDAIEQSVHAPIAMPKDVNELELGPFTVVQSDNPQQIGRVPLNISPGLFPESQILAQEQRTGSRYPEGRSGSIDASIVTGQGVQALMGTFDTQVQTFQRLNASALEDVIELCFRMDEAYWGDVKKTRRIKDNGSPRKVEYIPSKDIDGDYTIDVTYGAIAGLDPNRGLVFVLQALAGGLLSKQTARKTLPVDLNVVEEEKAIQLEQMDDSIAATLAMLPQAIPQMAAMGQDPRELTMQVVQARKLIMQGKSLSESLEKVFAPKEQPQAAPVDPMQQMMEQAQGGGGAPAMPGGGGGGAQDLLMSMAGLTAGGNANLQSNVSRMTPAAG